jgi:hypothetical protein
MHTVFRAHKLRYDNIYLFRKYFYIFNGAGEEKIQNEEVFFLITSKKN